jgi:hypothetical protein
VFGLPVVFGLPAALGLLDVIGLPTVFGRCRDRRATFRAAVSEVFPL